MSEATNKQELNGNQRKVTIHAYAYFPSTQQGPSAKPTCSRTFVYPTGGEAKRSTEDSTETSSTSTRNV